MYYIFVIYIYIYLHIYIYINNIYVYKYYLLKVLFDTNYNKNCNFVITENEIIAIF